MKQILQSMVTMETVCLPALALEIPVITSIKEVQKTLKKKLSVQKKRKIITRGNLLTLSVVKHISL